MERITNTSIALASELFTPEASDQPSGIRSTHPASSSGQSVDSGYFVRGNDADFRCTDAMAIVVQSAREEKGSAATPTADLVESS